MPNKSYFAIILEIISQLVLYCGNYRILSELLVSCLTVGTHVYVKVGALTLYTFR